MTTVSGPYGGVYTQFQSSAVQNQAVPTATRDSSSIAAVGGPATAQKSFAQVALDARSALDAGYQKLGGKADTYTTDSEWRNSVGIYDMDRRSLYAIASNQGGLFSETEMSAAQTAMTKQEGDAMAAADPTGKDFAAQFKAAIDFLDGVSDEEKGSLRWAEERAAAQSAYESRMKDEGRAPENVDSGNLIVQLMVKAYAEVTERNDPSQGYDKMPSWQKAMDLWHLQNETTETTYWTL